MEPRENAARSRDMDNGTKPEPDRRRTARLLRGFDRAVARTRDFLESRYGPSLAASLAAEARQEFARLAPAIPDLQGRQPFTQFVTATGWFLAFHRVLTAHGKPVREAGEFAYALTARYVESLPRVVVWLVYRIWFSKFFQARARRGAKRSQQRRGSGDFVFEYVESDAQRFDFGIDYVECAVWSFLKAQGAPELTPYICALDKLYSDRFGWGLVRTTTLGEGGVRCDFRFTRGGRTAITSSVLPLQER
jgi:hypothetical protein